MTDGLSERYRELMSGSYDCGDRIALNVFFGWCIFPIVSACGGGRSLDRMKPCTMSICNNTIGRSVRPSRARLCRSA